MEYILVSHNKRCFIVLVHILHRSWHHGCEDEPQVLRDPGEHGGVGTLTGGHSEAGGPHQHVLVLPHVHHQGAPTVTLGNTIIINIVKLHL